MSLTDIQKQLHDNADDIISKRPERKLKIQQLKMQNLRQNMQQLPLGRILLDWADENDIKIVIDHKTMLKGYYCEGLKLIGLNHLEPNTLAHEIMHAIQDQYGLIRIIEDVADLRKEPIQNYLCQTNFTEAAAFAIGFYIEKESQRRYRYERCKKDEYKPNPLKSDLDIAEAKEYLQQKFIRFFHSRKSRRYEESDLETYAEKIGIKDITDAEPRYGFHNMPDLKLPYHHGLHLDDETDCRKVGQVLNLFNFLDDLPKDFNRSAQFRKLSTDFSLNTDKVIHATYQEQIRQQNAVLFRQIKHLQKNL